jgi:aminopeptidase N
VALATQLEAEREALDALVRSDGWAFLLARFNAQWGDTAVVEQLRRALAAVPRGDEAAERSTTAQVLAAQKQLRELLSWPLGRIKEIEHIRLEAEKGRRAPAHGHRAFERHGVGSDITGGRS